MAEQGEDMFQLIRLKILLPFGIFVEENQVNKVVVDTSDGSYGFLPNRLDCVAALVPGILSYVTSDGTEKFVAIDEGILVKTGALLSVSVRNAVAGKELGKLKEAVENEIKGLDDRERDVRAVLSKLESSFVRQLQQLMNR